VDGDAVLRYRVLNEYYVPWQSANATTGGPFAFEVSYANKEVKLNDAVQVVATLINQTKDKTAPVIVELGVPAGYYPAYEDWQQLQDTGVVRGYQVEGTKIIVNLDGLDAGAKIELPYRLIANIPGSVRVPPSKVYQAITASDAVEVGTGEVLVVK
jgi:hypothetical protein